MSALPYLLAAGAAGPVTWWLSRRVWRPPPPLTEAELQRRTAPGGPSEGARFARLPSGELISWWEFGPPGALPLVALHGMGLSGRSFSGMEHLCRARNLRLVAPNLVGGLAHVPPSARLVDLSASVLRLMDFLGHERFDVLGTSFGTLPALGLAALAPRRVRRAGLFGPLLAGPWLAEAPELLRSVKREDRMVMTAAQRSPRLLHLMTALFGLYPTSVAIRSFMDAQLSDAERALFQPGHSFHASFSRDLEECGQRGFWYMAHGSLLAFGREPGFTLEQVDAGGVPLLLQTGARDNVHTPAMAEHLNRRLRHSTLHVVPGLGRFGCVGPFLEAGVARLLDLPPRETA